jgi:hypothetical protein
MDGTQTVWAGNSYFHHLNHSLIQKVNATTAKQKIPTLQHKETGYKSIGSFHENKKAFDFLTAYENGYLLFHACARC